MNLCIRVVFVWLLAAFPCISQPATKSTPNPRAANLELQKLPWFLGREYFVLRSGRAQLIVQADQADLGPAFTWLLYDACGDNQSQKEGALNFLPNRGFADSALVVELGGFPFTALGHRTQTRWVVDDGIPVVEAVWWAGGVRVTEHLAALGDAGVFARTIQLEGAHLVGAETVKLRLALPPGDCRGTDVALFQHGRGVRLALLPPGGMPTQFHEATGEMEIGPLDVAPGKRLQVATLLLTQIPASDADALIEQAGRLRCSAAGPEWVAMRAKWAASSSITTRDQTAQEIFDKARFGLPGLVADDGTMNAGLFEYGAQWVRDTSNTALGALHAGHFELARAAIVRMLDKMVSQEGRTMIANSFDSPDLEQFDQMGELLHLLRNYRDWTGDDSLIREHRERLLAMIERPLQPQFRDHTGMVHNRREFWERAFDDAYELAYQTYVILGLREAAELAPALSAEDRAARWQMEADRIQQAMLSHPDRALVQDGRLIKRRNVTGLVADDTAGFQGFAPDVPLKTERAHRLMPDASMALPIALGIVPARSELARRTLDDLERLWNARWSDGGHDRYHTSGQPDQPGPWPFATAFILRAEHDAGNYERSRRALDWLNTCQGGRAGLWFEETPSIRSLTPRCGLIGWTSGEMALFGVRHYLGLRFENGAPVIKPALYPGSPPVSADLRFRQGRLKLAIDGAGRVKRALVAGKVVKPTADGAIRLPRNFAGGSVVIETTHHQADKKKF